MNMRRLSIRTLAISGVLLIALIAIGVYYANIRASKKPITIHTSSSNYDTFNASLEKSGVSTKTSATQVVAGKNEHVEYTSNTTQIPSKANAAVLTWEQTGNEGVSIYVRTKSGNSWSQWSEISSIDGGKDGTEASGVASTIVLANNIDDIQFRARLSGSANEPSSSLDFRNTKIVGIDSSEGPSGKKNPLSSVFSYLQPSASALDGQPRIITRTEWGCPEANNPEWAPEYAELTRAIVHHTASTESSDSYADVRAIWQYHAKSLGWGDIGYNYIVDSQGRIFQGRYTDEYQAAKLHQDVVGGHAYNSNVGTVGVSVIGNYVIQQPTAASIDSVAKIIGYKLAKYRVAPSDSAAYAQTVIGHYQVWQTSCPGTNLINNLDNIRRRALNYFNFYLPYQNYIPLDTPQWMELNKDAYKRNPDTLDIEQTLPAKTQLKIVDKALRNGVWYYRTEYDSKNGLNKTIHQDSISQIIGKPITPATYMQLNSDRTKWDPRTGAIPGNQVFKAGGIVKVDNVLSLNGVDYYQTVYDKQNNNPWYFTAIGLSQPTFTKLNTPVYLNITTDTSYVNPLTGESGKSVTANTQLMFEYQLMLDQPYLQQASDHTDTPSYGLAQSSLQNPPYAAINTNHSSVRARIKNNTQKTTPSTQTSTGVSLSAGGMVEVSEYATVGPTRYYRTVYDSQHGIGSAIKEPDLDFIQYTAIEPGVEKTTSKATTKYSLSTLQPVESAIRAGTVLRIGSTVRVAGVDYYRTVYDTTYSLDKLIPVSDFVQ